MNYNQAHFDTKVIENLNNKIDMIMQCETLVLDSIKTFLKSTKSFPQTENFTSFIHLIIKMRFNIDAAHQLLALLKGDYRFKTSINVLYRSSLDDTINIYYLLGFVLTDNPTKKISENQTSLGNELDILHRDFLKSACKIIEAEIKSDKYYSKLNQMEYVPKPGTDGWMDEMIKANQHLYNTDKNTWKNNKEIRMTSSPIFNNKYPEGNNAIPETSKIEFIQNKGFERSFQLTQLFKYFSQFQHFSPKMHDFLLTTPEHDLEYYHKMLVEILCVVFECDQILITENKQITKDIFNANIVNLFKLYNDFHSTAA